MKEKEIPQANSDLFVFEESYESLPKSKGILRVVRGPVMEWGEDRLNRNNRYYVEAIIDKVLNSPYVLEQLANRTLFGEANHPQGRFEVDFSRVTHRIVELVKMPDRNQVYATIEVLDTPLGRILEVFYQSGSIMGYSTRAGGKLIKERNKIKVDPITYNFVTIDVVPFNSMKAARLETVSESVVELSDDVVKGILDIFESCLPWEKSLINDYLKSLKGVSDYNVEPILEAMEVAQELPPSSLPDIDESVEDKEKEDTHTMDMLKKSLTTLQTERNKIAVLESTVSRLESEKAGFKQTLDALRNELSSLRSDDSNTIIVEQLEAEIQMLEEKISSSEEKNKVLEMKVSESVLNASPDVESIRKEIVDRYSMVVEGLKAEIAEKSSLIEELESEVEILEGRALTAESSLNESVEIIENLEKEVSEINSTLENINEGYASDIESQSEQTEIFESQISSLNASVKVLQATNKGLQKKSDSLSSAVKDVNGKLDSIIHEAVEHISSGYNLNPDVVKASLGDGDISVGKIVNVCESLVVGNTKNVFSAVNPSISTNKTTNSDNSSRLASVVKASKRV